MKAPHEEKARRDDDGRPGRRGRRHAPRVWRVADDEFLGVAGRPEAARVHEALGAADSAIAAYERYLGARSLSRTGVDAFELGGALERLGALYERRGDRDPAAAAYARLAALWANGDPPFRRRARAAGARAAALVTPAGAGH